MSGVPVDQDEPMVEGNAKIFFVFAEGRVADIEGRIAHSAIVGELLESSAIVHVDLDKLPISPSNAQELVVFWNVDVIPTIQFIGITDVGI